MSAVPPPQGGRTVDLTHEQDPTKPLQPEKSLGELLGEVTSEFTHLIRDEVALAKVELQAEAKKAGRAGGLLGVAGVAGLLALLLLSMAAAYGLAALLPTGWAFAAVGAGWLVVAAITGMTGKTRIQELHPTPEQAVESVKEDVAWARTQIS